MSAYICHQCDSHDSDINAHNHAGGVDIGPSPPPASRESASFVRTTGMMDVASTTRGDAMDSVGARARRRGDERAREREMGDDDDDDDDDAIGDARSAVWDGALVTRDDVFKRFDDETRRTTIDADAELAEIFARDSTSTSTATATARDGALDAFDAFDAFDGDFFRRESTRARREGVDDTTRYCSSCKQHLTAERFPGAHRKTCTTCLRLHKTYQRRRRRRTKLCDERESRVKR